MTDKEKLIELIRCASFHPVEGVRATIGSRFTAEFIEDIASHMVANGVTFVTDTNVGSKWIPVTERLPEMKADVLMYFAPDKNMAAGFMCDVDEDKTMWCAYTDGGFYTDCDFEPTHWMPMPKPPEDGGADHA